MSILDRAIEKMIDNERVLFQERMRRALDPFNGLVLTDGIITTVVRIVAEAAIEEELKR